MSPFPSIGNSDQQDAILKYFHAELVGVVPDLAARSARGRWRHQFANPFLRAGEEHGITPSLQAWLEQVNAATDGRALRTRAIQRILFPGTLPSGPGLPAAVVLENTFTRSIQVSAFGGSSVSRVVSE